jgi:aspartyl-tRNA(Asn)/glutamyl-tRNA(Gln) amidotransferase subunit C
MFSKSDLYHVARLARLSLTDEEVDKLGKELDRIINFVTQLNEVDVDNVEPMSYAGDRTLPFRADEASVPLGRECLKLSLGYEEGLVRVPKIIE